MGRRLTGFVFLSLILHSGALLWSPYRAPLPRGSADQALQLRLAPAGEPRAQPAAPGHRPAQTTSPSPAPKASPTPSEPATVAVALRPAPAPRPSPPPTHPAPAQRPEPAPAAPAPAPKQRVSERTGTSKPEPELRAAAETQIHHLLAAHFHYPLLARRKGWQGRVQLGLRLQADGRLTQVRVVRSSGHGILDRSARQAAEAIGRLPDTRLPVDHYDLVVPVHYRLLDERAGREGGDYHG